MAERNFWSGTVRGSCLKCGSGKVAHLNLGMPDPDMAAEAPDWMSWSCVYEGPDRVCADCDFRWFAPGAISGFRNIWEVLAFYGVDNLHALGDWFTELYGRDISFDLHPYDVEELTSESFHVTIRGMGSLLHFPFLEEELVDDIDVLMDRAAQATVTEGGPDSESSLVRSTIPA